MTTSPSPAPPPSPEQSARELDRTIAERLFGWSDFGHAPALGLVGKRLGAQSFYRVPHYSTDPAAMMEVLTALDAKGYDISIENSLPDWRCTIIWQQNDAWDGSHKSLPRAVCLAALAALAAAAPEGTVPRA